MTILPGGIANGSPVATGCANQPSKCLNVGSSIPGYREWWYTVDYTLPIRCNYWKFSVIENARNTSANIAGGSFYAEARLNNVAVQQNSSPVFSVKPVPYVCLNQPYKYNNGGVDPNGDSVAFEVINPQTNSSCGSLPSNLSFVAASPTLSIPNNPFQTNNTFTISPTTGELSFTPALQGAHTVTVRANEYRNGVFIGSVMRDIQVQVINCMGSGVTPTLKTDSLSVTGSAIYSGGAITACATKPFTFCYDIKSTDTNAKLVVTDNSGVAMPGSFISYSTQQTDSIRGCVTWTPSPIDTGNRVFVVTVKDSSCTSSGVVISHSITVPVYVWAVTAALKDTAICSGDSTQLTGVGGTAYTWSVVPGGAPITSLSCTTCKSPIAKPSVTTKYIVTSNSSSFCGQYTDTVTVSVIQNVPSGSSNSPVCPGDTLRLFANVAGVTYSWSGPNGFTSNLKNPVIPNSQPGHSGFYSLVVSNGVCTSQTLILQVVVATPAGPTASSNSPVCLGNQVILTATTVSGTTVTYHWSGPGGYTSTAQNTIKNNAAFTDSGKYIVYAMKDGCKTFSDSVNIIVNPIPAAPVAALDSVFYCQSVTAAPLAATGTNLKWYNVPVGGTGSTTLTPSTAVPGIFKYYVSQTSGCEGPRDSVVVVIKPKPASPGVVSSQGFCQGAAMVPLTATGTNLQWYTTPVGGTPLGFTPTPSSATPGSTIFFVSQTDAGTGCESDRASMNIVIYAPAPAPLVASPVLYCVGGPVSPSLASQVTGSNIKWYTDATGGVGSSTAPAISTAAIFTDTFYVSQTLNSCEGARTPLIVIVQANSAPPLTTNVAYCQYAIATPLTATGTNLLWYTASSGGTGSTTAPVPQTIIPGTITYYVTQTINGCESTREPLLVTINPKPQPPLGNDDSICQNTVAAALTATGTNLRWYATATGGGIGSTMPPVPVTDSTGTYYWYVSQSILGCESERDTVVIEVKPQPLPPESDTAQFCYNAPPLQLSAVGQNLLWYTVPVGGTGSSTAPTPGTSVIGYTNYYVTQTVNGCESRRDTLAVKVDTLLRAEITLSDTIVCLHDSLVVGQVDILPDSSIYTWLWNGGEVLSGDSSGPFVIKWNTVGKKTIIHSAENNGCRAADTISVEVLHLPDAWFNMVPEVCLGTQYQFKLDTVLKYAVGYNWSLDPRIGLTGIDSNTDEFTITWKEPGLHVFRLRTVSEYGCVSAEFADTVNVRDYPRAKILLVDNNTVCMKTEITLKTASLPGLHQYEWSPAEYFVSNKASEVQARIQSSGYLKVTVTDKNGCKGIDSTYVGVKLCCEISLPSAFSPNNDGRNDRFGIISKGNYRILTFRIVNRYGREVFSTTNQNERWDGTYKEQPQGIGTYYYYIKYTCQDDDADHEVEERGDLTLIR